MQEQNNYVIEREKGLQIINTIIIQFHTYSCIKKLGVVRSILAQIEIAACSRIL